MKRLFLTIADLGARADVYGTLATANNTNPPQKIDSLNMGTKIRYLNEVYTQGAADGNVGDVINLPPLPVGAKVIGHLSTCTFSAGNANATLAIGKTGAATALKTATAIADAGTFIMINPAAGVDDVTIGADERLIATNATAAIKAGQVIRFRIAYVERS
ncbi:MAG TPA: hypothetical protein DCZ63_08490 [Geobacter sp.]|nr:hypothetical protein [Geobacter sp.]